jgi:cobalt transporter subunit CbtB
LASGAQIAIVWRQQSGEFAMARTVAKTATAPIEVVGSKTSVKLAAGGAALLGIALLWGVGFASPALLHNAAHDTRHTVAFPCH